MPLASTLLRLTPQQYLPLTAHALWSMRVVVLQDTKPMWVLVPVTPPQSSIRKLKSAMPDTQYYTATSFLGPTNWTVLSMAKVQIASGMAIGTWATDLSVQHSR